MCWGVMLRRLGGPPPEPLFIKVNDLLPSRALFKLIDNALAEPEVNVG